MVSCQCTSKALIRLLDVQVQLPRLLLAKFIRRLHLVQRNEPLHNLAPVVEILIRHTVHRLDHIREERMQLVLGQEAELDGVEEGDELLRRLQDEHAAGVVGGGCGS